VKIEYTASGIAKISFESRGMVNPMVNMPMLDKDGKQRIEDVWLPIELSAAKAIEVLLSRIDRLEQELDLKGSEARVEQALDVVATASLDQKKKLGPKKKAS
jgi:hypothetical protein